MKKKLQNCNITWYVDIKTTIAKYKNIDNNISIVEKVLIRGKREKKLEWRIQIHAICLLHKLHI